MLPTSTQYLISLDKMSVILPSACETSQMFFALSTMSMSSSTASGAMFINYTT